MVSTQASYVKLRLLASVRQNIYDATGWSSFDQNSALLSEHLTLGHQHMLERLGRVSLVSLCGLKINVLYMIYVLSHLHDVQTCAGPTLSHQSRIIHIMVEIPNIE